jgi:hypothetical protein
MKNKKILYFLRATPKTCQRPGILHLKPYAPRLCQAMSTYANLCQVPLPPGHSKDNWYPWNLEILWLVRRSLSTLCSTATEDGGEGGSLDVGVWVFRPPPLPGYASLCQAMPATPPPHPRWTNGVRLAGQVRSSSLQKKAVCFFARCLCASVAIYIPHWPNANRLDG